MNIAYIGLGSNLGESQNFLSLAIEELRQHPAIGLLVSSSFYRSSPVDSTGPDYINAVAYLETSLEAMELLHLLQAIELKHGRQRPYRNAPRTLDLDILLFNDNTSDDPVLTLPHPRMHERAFVLEPLKELYALLAEQTHTDRANPSEKPLHAKGYNVSSIPTPQSKPYYTPTELNQLIQAAKATGQEVFKVKQS
ncbi:2-amino-4-hydroxy-6-hydroxymethyldihydropteridine diphosphokinase [Pelistega europaea]|uniref:2-amino-4-hydroxy-6-hydroxymethyldihydropteridine pyrophosphokinase n=1 Tax=Pelistega europaea TaxID=106147 RepID=A0A7Y4LB36_9BURK|nr:2-amino-4-hydroxy-6-hydroxymethyldihydropteridine diphosphokinase [Pelistega europaea]NOL50259.1 2-amino-4-hydroxy-6-hydroxymethyldihydropteridine diphosphokinase [Pelistega europaea]